MKNIVICVITCGFILLAHGGGLAQQIDPASVVARVNGEAIFQSEVDVFMNALALPKLRAANPGQVISPEQMRQVEQNIISQLINQKLILTVAAELQITADQQVVNERFENAQDRYQGINSEELKHLIENELLFEETIKSIQQGIASNMTISDEDIRRFYEEQKNRILTQIANQITDLQQRLEGMTDKEERKILENQLRLLQEQQALGPFSEPEQIRASHILLKVAPDGEQEEKAAAREKLEDLLKQIQQGGNFAELARAHSEDPGSKEKGGDLGFFGRGMMVAAFEDVAFALPVGQVSDIVETSFGYHIILVTDKKSQREVSFDELKNRFREPALTQKINTEMNAWFANLRSNAKIEILTIGN